MCLSVRERKRKSVSECERVCAYDGVSAAVEMI